MTDSNQSKDNHRTGAIQHPQDVKGRYPSDNNSKGSLNKDAENMHPSNNVPKSSQVNETKDKYPTGDSSMSSQDMMKSLRDNLQFYMGEKNLSVHQLAENANISYETLKSLIYGKAKDCHISTAVALAKSMGISIDELINAGTIEPVVLESFKICRRLPFNYLRFVRWAIRYHARMMEVDKSLHKSVNVIIAESTNEGNIILSNNFEIVDISNMPEIVRPKIFMGIKLPSDNYMPKYGQNDILLIANDRNPLPSEVSVITLGGFIWLAKRVVDGNDEKGNPIVNYYSIRDGKFRVSEVAIDESIGYIAGVSHN